MTAPTPDLDYDTIWESGRADGYEAGTDEYAHALAAVTADRDQARQQLADAHALMANARAVADAAGIVNWEEDNYAAGARDVAEELGEAGL